MNKSRHLSSPSILLLPQPIIPVSKQNEPLFIASQTRRDAVLVGIRIGRQHFLHDSIKLYYQCSDPFWLV